MSLASTARLSSLRARGELFDRVEKRAGDAGARDRRMHIELVDQAAVGEHDEADRRAADQRDEAEALLEGFAKAVLVVGEIGPGAPLRFVIIVSASASSMAESRISASSGRSAGRYGRSEGFGKAALAFMASAPSSSCHPYCPSARRPLSSSSSRMRSDSAQFRSRRAASSRGWSTRRRTSSIAHIVSRPPASKREMAFEESEQMAEQCEPRPRKPPRQAVPCSAVQFGDRSRRIQIVGSEPR